MSDPRPMKRVRLDKRGWESLRGQLFGSFPRCRCCSEYAGWGGMSLHHLVPRSLGGDDVVENLVVLCGDGTTGCHGLIEARDRLTLGVLRAHLEPAELEYMTRKKGSAFVDRYYPALEEAA